MKTQITLTEGMSIINTDRLFDLITLENKFKKALEQNQSLFVQDFKYMAFDMQKRYTAIILSNDQAVENLNKQVAVEYFEKLQLQAELHNAMAEIKKLKEGLPS